MVLIISTFKVANGMEGAVRQAFLDRPGLVENASGFLGMEVAVDRQDASIFHLMTRWTDEASFQRWHSSPLHKLSHRGIPKGLKLDATHTVIRRLDVLPGKGCFTAGQTTDSKGPSFIGNQFLDRTRSLHWMKASLDGRIIAANPAFGLLLQESGETLPGESLWDRMTQSDASSIQKIVQSESPDFEGPLLLNFVSRDHDVHTLECYLERHGEDFVLVGEPVHERDHALANELLELNNRWALLARENEKNVRALRQALADLDQSHWHLRKIQETLPICMYCGKVKTGDAQWEGVVEYLKANSLFLSHGCCPACLDRMGEPESGGREC
jgi:heme-degrading monooxygenase HmoA